MTATLRFGDREVGTGLPVYVIAEIGSNHNGDLETAKQMIQVCADAGVDAVKFQAFTREGLFIESLPDDGSDARQRDEQLLRRRWDVLPQVTAPSSWWPELAEVAAALGVAFTCTPFSLKAVEQIAALQPPLLKIASGDVTWHELISAAASTGVPLVLSTGASDLDEVVAAVGAARAGGAEQLALLHCVSSYPPEWDEAQLRAIVTLRERFGVPVGLSDHSPGSTLPVAATALGACIVEKHVTLDRTQDGLDHHFALEPAELAELVTDLRHAHEALGRSGKTWAPTEEKERFWVRRGLWVRREVAAGSALVREDLSCLRPHAGMGADQLHQVLGRAAARDLEPGQPLLAMDVQQDGPAQDTAEDAEDTPEVVEVTSEALARACAAFFQRMLDEVFAATFPTAAIAQYRERFDADLFVRRATDPGAAVVCARAGQDVVGLVLGGPPNGGVASLDWVVVAEAWRGRGLARRMLDMAVAAYRRGAAHKLVLYTETPEARDFYARVGWRQEGHHASHWWGLAHTCMTLQLDGTP